MHYTEKQCLCLFARHHQDGSECRSASVTVVPAGSAGVAMCRQCAALALAALDVTAALQAAALEAAVAV